MLLISWLRNAYKLSARKPEVKRQLGRLRSKWNNNIKMDFKEIGCECLD
jgi:hypothetical protein